MPSSTLLSRDSDAHQLPEEGLHGLHRAAARGDLARLRKHWWLKRLGKNRLDQAKRTPLHLACANGHADVVRFLVQEKCLLNLCDNTGRSPLMKAVESQHEECVAILLEHHADPNLEGYGGNSALHLAAAAPSTSLTEMLVEHGARLEAKNWGGNTPLLLAISSNHKEMVNFLLQKGATVCAKNDFGRTALMLAASVGEMDVVDLLLSYGATITCKDVAGYTAVDYALQSGHIGIARKLVERAHCEKTGEASADAAQDTAVPSRFCPLTTERFLFHTRALDGEGALPAVGAEQEEDAELPTDHKDRDRELQLELPVALQRLLRLQEATREYTESQRSDMEKGIQYLRAQLNVFKAEDRDRQLQMELPGAPESLSVSEAPPEATESQRRDDEKDAERLREELRTAKAELKELSQQLEMESEKRRQLEAQNCDLQEELSALRGSQEKLEKTNGQLQEEVAYIFVFGVLPLFLSVRCCSPLVQKSP
ncbi:POTE ankyrin domain family member B-like [Anas acuta]|uniref:POTE ankyrin domain family member B-like n=1 Tax=Anas acuta TaxID=28680 RepID=UPI0035C91A8B